MLRSGTQKWVGSSPRKTAVASKAPNARAPFHFRFKPPTSPRNYANALRLGVERVHVMFIQDSDNYNGGLFNRNGSWRPSAHAVKTMISVLPEPKFLAAISDGEEGNYAYQFAPSSSNDAKPVIMAWNIKGPATARIPFAASQATITDMLGGKSTVSSEGGSLSLPVGPLPIYISE